MNDIRRIAFVVDRYLELQGLGPALFGSVLIFSTLLHHAIGSPSRHTDSYQVFMLAGAVNGSLAVSVQRMYRRTYGDVVATWTQKLAAARPLALVMLGAFVDLTLFFDRPRSGPSLAAVALTAQSCWVLLRDWRWRIHYLAGAAAGISAAIVTASVVVSPGLLGVDPPRTEAYLLACALMGLGLVVTGLLDHRLLASSLRPAAPAAEDRRVDWPQPTMLWTALAVGAPAAVCLQFSDSALPFALPLALLLTTIVSVVVFALRQAARGVSDFRAGRRPTVDSGVPITMDDDVLVAMLIVAVAATLDSALFASLAPLALAIGASTAWLAARRWRERKRYLVWTLASAWWVLVPRTLSTARTFDVFLLAMAIATAIAAAIDFLSSPKDRLHADTV